MIDFHGSDTDLLLNPRLHPDDRTALERIAREAPALRAHVWIATSGTTGSLRLVALSKEAILASARAVNAHVAATASDVWLSVLPTFHVGGLGIYARAALTQSRVVAVEQWDAAQFVRTSDAEGVTLASLVPAQMRDLIAASHAAPPSVRAIVVGGGAMAPDVYAAARALGWPVLPSYGMTETSSQVATATGESPDLKVLSHIEARVEDGCLAFRGPSLLTGYAYLDDSARVAFEDPKIDGWFISQDRGEVSGGVLRPLGRAADFVKIGGESVDIARLDRILDSLRGPADAAIVAVPEERLGFVIHLAAASDDVAGLVTAFNERVLPFERIRSVRRVAAIPRSPIGKLLRHKLLAELR